MWADRDGSQKNQSCTDFSKSWGSRRKTTLMEKGRLKSKSSLRMTGSQTSCEVPLKVLKIRLEQRRWEETEARSTSPREWAKLWSWYMQTLSAPACTSSFSIWTTWSAPRSKKNLIETAPPNCKSSRRPSASKLEGKPRSRSWAWPRSQTPLQSRILVLIPWGSICT